MIKFNKKILLILLSTTLVMLFFLIPISKIINFNWLFAIDPWVHMSLTKNLEPEQLYWNEIKLYDNTFSTQYPSFMRTYLYEFHLITWADYISIFKYFGFITRFFLLLVILIFIRKFILTNKKNIFHLPLIVCLLLWYSYFWYRAWITFPENFVLIFHWLLLFFSTLYIYKKNNFYLFFIVFFTSISIYYHIPSFVIAALIIFWFSLVILYKERLRWFTKLLIMLVGVFILSFPVLKILISNYTAQLTENIGSNIQSYWDITRFTAPSFTDYISFSSLLIIIFSFLWLIYYAKKHTTRKKYIYMIPFFVLFLGTFILTNWTRFYINVPMDRMQWYFIFPLIILASYGFIQTLKKYNPWIKIIIVNTILMFSILTVNSSEWWFKLRKWETEITVYLAKNISNNKKYYFDTWISFFELQFANYKSIVTNKANLTTGDWIITYNIYNTGNLIYESKQMRIYQK